MKSDWIEYNLLEVFDVTNGLSKNRKEFGFGYPFLTFKEVFNNYFVPEELVSLANTTEKERAKCSIRRGDVFITRTSEKFEELGITCVSLNDYPEASFNGFTKRLRPKNNVEIDPEYSSFYFKSPYFRQQILSLTTMTTRASLNNEMLDRLTIVLPPLDEQKEIARILFDCHYKIQLNRQTNQTLEQMAQAIFKCWFVDFEPVRVKAHVKGLGGTRHQCEMAAQAVIAGALSLSAITDETNLTTLDQNLTQALQVIWAKQTDEQKAKLAETAKHFPDGLVASELGEIPMGWEIQKVNEIVKRLKPKKRYTKKDVNTYGETPVFEQGSGIVLGYHDDEPGFMATPQDPIFIFGDHTCITHLSCQPFDISQNVIPVEGKELPTLWVYYAVRELQKFQEYRRHWSEFVIKSVVVPDGLLSENFAIQTVDFLRLNEKNGEQNNILKQVRDTLLPKLLSGEIDVNSF